jgi:hypothetical protein
VVHVFEEGQRLLADRFAGLRPSPGGIFSDLEVIPGPYGPQVAGIATRAFCRLAEVTEQGYQHLVRGDIDGVELGELERPLVHFRGRYRPLSG